MGINRIMVKHAMRLRGEQVKAFLIPWLARLKAQMKAKYPYGTSCKGKIRKGEFYDTWRRQ